MPAWRTHNRRSHSGEEQPTQTGSVTKGCARRFFVNPFYFNRLLLQKRPGTRRGGTRRGRQKLFFDPGAQRKRAIKSFAIGWVTTRPYFPSHEDQIVIINPPNTNPCFKVSNIKLPGMDHIFKTNELHSK